MIRKTLIILLLASWTLLPAAADLEPYIAKAAMLEKIPRYINWPAESGMKNTSTPFVIGVIGKNPFGSILEKAFTRDRKINKKQVKIVYFSSPDEIKDCHLLFISAAEKKNLSKIFSIIQNKPVLTISDTTGFAQRGVHINFVKSGQRLRFEINPIAVRQASLSIDPSFLAIGKIVRPVEKKK